MLRRNILKHCLSFVVLVLMVVLAIGSGGSSTDTSTKKVQSQKPKYTVSASQIFKEYVDNEIAADDKYKGQVIIISGVVSDIGRDITEEAYINLSTGDPFFDVQCLFTKGEEPAVAKLSKGKNVRIKGVVSGKIGLVTLQDCSLQ